MASWLEQLQRELAGRGLAVASIPGKGRGLIATRTFFPGETARFFSLSLPNRWRRFSTTREAWRLLPTNCSMKCANRTCRERWCHGPMTRIDTSLNWCDDLLLRCVGSVAWPSPVLTESCGVWLQGMSFSIRNLTLLRLTRF
jgi:hypothetical protein